MIRIGIYGYGNLGRGVEAAIKKNSDMKLVAVFTRRDPQTVKINTEGVKVFPSVDVKSFVDDIDVMILCGGSATDLPLQTPELCKYFNVVDSFDTHARIFEHYQNVDKNAKESGKIGVISTGWDPGMFSLNRAIMNAILPGKDYEFELVEEDVEDNNSMDIKVKDTNLKNKEKLTGIKLSATREIRRRCASFLSMFMRKNRI